MRRTRILAALLLLLALAACPGGCGYRFAGVKDEAPFVLPAESRKLWLKSVENPTVETWLGPAIRSLLRDEITNRGQAQWVDKDEATAWVEVVVDDFTTETTVTGEQDESLKYSAAITMIVTIRSALDGRLLWSSGSVGANESFYGAETHAARVSAVELAVERAVDRMSQKY